MVETTKIKIKNEIKKETERGKVLFLMKKKETSYLNVNDTPLYMCVNQ